MKGYILRWNPNISSWTYDMHERLIKDFVCDKSVGMNWSIFDFEELEIGDFFILQQVGTDNDGIAMVGTFISEPYTEASWKKKDGTNLFYADMKVDLIINRNNKKNKSLFSAEELQQKFSEIDWHKGHSGVLIPQANLEDLILEICSQMFMLRESSMNIGFYSTEHLWQKACDYINYFCPDMRNKIIEKRQNDLIYKNYSDGEVIDKSLMDITFDNEKMNNKTHFNIDSFPDYLIPRA
jgi:hypothetical protein